MSSFFGDSVAIRSNGDTDYVVTDAYSGTAANDELGIAQPIYMHNVIPVSHGFQSVDYATELDNSCAGQSGFDTMIPLRDVNGLNHLLSPANGQNFISADGATWSSSLLSTDTRLSGEVSFAYIQSQTYVCYRNLGIYRYDPVSRTLQELELIGLNSDQVSGITSAYGMLIVWTDDTIYRSSFENPEDFTPSLRTGAGSQQITQARGNIVACLPHTGGFIMYCTENAVYANGTSDLAYPFSYEEVKGSAGLISAAHVASDTTFGVHYAWTKAGLQSISADTAKLLFPEVTDFLTCGYLEDYVNNWDGEERIGTEIDRPGQDPFHEGYYSSCPNNLIQRKYELPLEIKVNVVGARYLAISYGIGELTHVLLWDLGLARMGKLRIPHVDIFTFAEPETVGAETARDSFGLLQKDGTIRRMDMRMFQPATDSVFFFGRLSMNRAAFTTLDEFSLLGHFDPAGQLTVNDILTIDGATMLEDIYLMPMHATKFAMKYGARTTGENHILKLMGTFSLSSISCKLEAGGDR
jgi:hypothetical protein